MKTYRGIIKGNTIVLDEHPDLLENCPAWREITPLEPAQRDDGMLQRHLELIAHPYPGGQLLYQRREELYDR